jgi:O-antigen/teichoic acid export membrane protein
VSAQDDEDRGFVDEERIDTNQAEEIASIDAESNDSTPPDSGAEESPVDDSPGETSLLHRALRAAGSDAARYLPVRFVPAITSLATVPIFTNTALISPSDYGAFFLVSSAASFGAALATSWIQSSLVRFYWPSKRQGKMDAFTSTVVWSATGSLIATAVVAAAAAYFARDALSPQLMRLIPVGIAFFVMNFLTNTLVQILRAAKRASAYAKLQVGGVLLTTALSIFFVWFGKLGSAGILAGAALGWTIMLVPMLKAISAEGSLSPRKVSRPMLAELLAYGMPLIPVGISSWTLVLLDRYVIAAFGSTAQVSLYSVAYSLGEKIMQLATMPLLLTMAPSLVETFENRGQPLAEKVQTQFVRYFAIVTLPLIAGMASAAQPFMRVFTGPAYWSAWPVLPIVAAGSMLNSFANIAGTGLGLHKKTKLIMVQALVAAGFNLVANLLLVPRFGYVAAAYNTLAAYILLVALAWWQSRPYMRLQLPWGDLGRIASASLGMGIAVWLPFSGVVSGASRPLSLAILCAQAILGIIVYVVLLRVFRAVRPDELEFIAQTGRSALSRFRKGVS